MAETSTPETLYHTALAYEDGLKEELQKLNDNLPNKVARYNGELAWLNSISVANFCDGRGGTMAVRNTPTVLQNLQRMQDQVKPCTKRVESWRAYLKQYDLTGQYNTRNAAANALSQEIAGDRKRIKELTDVEIPQATSETQEAYNNWQKWKYDQLSPEEKAELNQIAADAEYLDILNQGRKYAIYAVIALVVIMILWAFYKFVIKKGA